MISVDTGSAVPLQEQIRAGFRELVVKGLLKPGDPLPPAGELAERLLISPAAVSRAYNQMLKDGFLVKRSAGCFVSDTAWSQSTQNLVDTLQQLLESIRLARQSGLEWKDVEDVVKLMQSGGKENVPEILKRLHFFSRPQGDNRKAICPFCRETLGSGDVVWCFVCGTTHHAECWNEAKRCSVFGCKGNVPFVL